MKNIKIKLGDKVRDKVSGYEGIAVARTEFINGCTQYTVQRKLKGTQELNPMGEPSIDEMCLEVIQKRVIVSKEYELEKIKDKKKEQSNGGPITFNRGMRGY
jgi:heat shock protein HspQ